MAAVIEDGRRQDKMISWYPTSQLMVIRALSLFTMHCSYRNSAGIEAVAIAVGDGSKRLDCAPSWDSTSHKIMILQNGKR